MLKIAVRFTLDISYVYKQIIHKIQTHTIVGTLCNKLIISDKRRRNDQHLIYGYDNEYRLLTYSTDMLGVLSEQIAAILTLCSIHSINKQ